MAGVWADGTAYEQYMGRWSRRLAPLCVEWLDLPAGLRWADLGSGAGALSRAILASDPASVLGVEPSPGFLAAARSSVTDERVSFVEGSLERLLPASCDVVVAGLVLNFLPDAEAAVARMAAAAPGGTVAAYVWDYDEGLEMVRRFWDVVARVAGGPVGGSKSFPLCRPEALASLFGRHAREVETTGLAFTMEFADFDDYWLPFSGGTGPAPAYVARLASDHRERLGEALRSELAPDGGGIRLPARAWAVRGRVAT